MKSIMLFMLGEKLIKITHNKLEILTEILAMRKIFNIQETEGQIEVPRDSGFQRGLTGSLRQNRDIIQL